jgi:linoleoyl-CoA desaturase
MSAQGVKFNVNDQPEFFKEVRKKVNKYFKENNISKHANGGMVFKTAFMLSLYFMPLILMLTGVVSSLWPVMLMWVLMGLGMAGIGMSVMHDANHGSYSKNKHINSVLGFMINFLGGYHVNWKIQHNVLHHSFTNVEDYDEDIKIGLMRFSPNQKRHGIYRFQIFYAPFLYGLMSAYWLISKDFQGLVRYHKKDLLKGQGLTLTSGITHALINKIWYVGLTLVLPIILVPIPWWQTFLGFFLMLFICSIILSFIFQVAHVINETEFYVANENGSLENNWAIHQMNTTANFGDRSMILSWFIGGLNYQIEHHLFPNICHVHYKKISKIVKETADEFTVPYLQHKSYFTALRSHLSLLNALGTGKYDKMIAKA